MSVGKKKYLKINFCTMLWKKKSRSALAKAANLLIKCISHPFKRVAARGSSASDISGSKERAVRL
jgi:hypothetical protein